MVSESSTNCFGTTALTVAILALLRRKWASNAAFDVEAPACVLRCLSATVVALSMGWASKSSTWASVAATTCAGSDNAT
eukprot:11224216-Lingulodinium_polyedra.AAC.1